MDKKICFQRRILITVIVFSVFALTAATRCGYARTPFATETVWRDKGQDVTLNCPGYKNDSLQNHSVEYSWFRQDYNCEGMATSSIIAYHRHGGESLAEEPENTYSRKMSVDKTSGRLTIRNLTVADEHSFTCLFTRLNEYIATVNLKIKEFEPPVFTDLPDAIFENEVRYAKCMVPKMHPATGFIEVRQDNKIITVDLLEGQLPSVVVPISGEAKSNGNNLTCTAVQNVSGAVKRLSASVQVNALYSYHTKVISSAPDRPMESTNVTLTCEVTREGNPKEITGYNWLKDGREMTNGQLLHLGSISEDDLGSYQCLITNRAGIKTPIDAARKLQLDVVPLLFNLTTEIAAVAASKVSTASLAGYSILGCIGSAAVIGLILWAVCARHKKNRKSLDPIYEDHYEYMGKWKRNKEKEVQRNPNTSRTLSGISESVNHYEESNLLAVHSEGPTPCPPAPPPLPDRDLTGLKLLEDCPETDQHYKNRTAIMAAIPKKPSFRISMTDSLGNLLEYCKEYSTSQNKSGASGPPIPDEYVDMKNSAICGAKKDLDTPSNRPAQLSGSAKPHDGSAPLQAEGIKSEYMDMRGIDKSKATELPKI